ncbi:MAG: polysaccharide biosynthesis protein [Phycisphaerales bacterium JB050]
MPTEHTTSSSTDSSPVTPRSERMLIVGTAETIERGASAVCQSKRLRKEAIGAILLGDPMSSDSTPTWACGIPNLGSIDDLGSIVSRTGATIAMLCLPAAMTSLIRRTESRLADAGLTVRHFPLIEDIASGLCHSGPRANSAGIDPIHLFDRKPRPIDEALVRRVVEGKRVLVTGAGGSIGSELVRICASHDPSLLILMDRSDNALFEIDRQLRATHPEINRRVVLHDVVDAPRTLERLEELRPDVVFHAAAHKHVPLMEDHPAAAVNNNLFGTVAVADAAIAVGVERFVMISTDKAVNPTSVMGATKRMAELYVRSLNECQQKTRFSLVRFGNVLGSACSVLPIWGKQIAEGGPVTVTDPRMTRYFMTIPEAAALVIQSAALVEPESESDPAHEVFVLDMGEPVRIIDLATRFIEAHGLSPLLPESPSTTAACIRVVFTGKRPGEKLHEELVYDAEQLEATSVPGVRAWAGERPIPEQVAAMLSDMTRIRTRTDIDAVIESIARYIPQLTQTQTNQTPVISTTPATVPADAA